MPYISKTLLEYIKENILPKDVEVCGYLLFASDGEVMIQESATGNAQEARPSCILPHRANHTWHSHFLRAKSYPSAEDILSVMKKRDNPKEQSLLELIFTRWGIWNITSINKGVFNVQKELVYLTERGDEIYRACNGGKTDFYDIKAIKIIISRITNHYSEYGLVITFTLWTEIQGSYLI